MRILTRRLTEAEGRDPAKRLGELALTYDRRIKSRTRARLATGEELGLELERGTILRNGDVLGTESGEWVRITAAPEALLHVTASDPLQLTRIAYHLGNRHVPVQVGADAAGGYLRLQEDHVLEGMVRGLGGAVTRVSAPFDPEAGAYGHGGAHAHHHHHGDSAHDHDHPGHETTELPGRHTDERHAPRIHDFTVRDGSK